MNELKVFENGEFGKVRMIEENGKPLFCGSDVARALGYSRPNDAVNDHCRSTVKRRIPHPQSVEKEIEVIFIPEGDVYRLITHSKLPKAEEFEKWVFDEVLPTIRKTGGYVANDDLFINTYLPTADDATKLMFRTTLATVWQLNEEKQQLQQTVSVQAQQISEMQPKVTYYDIVLNCKDLVAISVIAKDYGWSAKHMNQHLYEKGVQYKQGSIWLLYQKYASSGYTSTKTYTYQDWKEEAHTTVQTYWTQKGRLFIYEMMKADGNLPLIEQ